MATIAANFSTSGTVGNMMATIAATLLSSCIERYVMATIAANFSTSGTEGNMMATIVATVSIIGAER
jgi:hypothetical protein